MQKKLLPLLILPVLALASCGGPSTGTTTSASTTPTTTPSAVNNTTPVTNPTPTVSTQDAGDQTMSAEEAQMLRDLNAARAVARTCGSKQMPAVQPVTWNGYLASAARAHALDMAANGFFSHTSPTNGGIDTRANAAGYQGWKELGENIAAGQNLGNVMAAWLASPGHCETLMDANLKEVGVAYLYRPGSKFGTYFVQDFGRR